MAWYRGGSSGGGSGYEYDVIKELTLISDSGGNKTISFSDIRSYAYVYILIVENNPTLYQSYDHARILPVSPAELGNNTKTLSVGYLWDSGNVNITLTYNSLTCNSYANPYHNMYAEIIGSNTSLF